MSDAVTSDKIASPVIRSPFVFRPGTCDENVYRAVVELNEYRLPEKFGEDDVILDVGAHIGSFAKACMNRGAGEVICFEPDPGNFSLAVQNLSAEIARGDVFVLPTGIWRSEQDAWILRHSGYSGDGKLTASPTEEAGEINTGGGDLLARETGTAVVALGLDFVLAEICDRQAVRLLKLDCEYSEWPILLTSELLNYQVEAICGEFHEVRDGLAVSEVPEHASIRGGQPWTEALLRTFLESRNYKVETRRQPNCEHLGLFWAWRDGFEFLATDSHR